MNIRSGACYFFTSRIHRFQLKKREAAFAESLLNPELKVRSLGCITNATESDKLSISPRKGNLWVGLWIVQN